MKQITSLELRYIVEEVQFLKGLRIENIYHSNDEIRIVAEGNILTSSLSKFYLKKKLDDEKVSDFALLLRRYLKNKVINNIEQHGLSIEIATDDNILIMEISPGFNCILCDSSYNIIMPLNIDKTRDIMPKMKYLVADNEDLQLIEKNPQVVYKNKNVFDAVPFNRDEYKSLDKKYFPSFNEALDYFFSKIKSMERMKKTEARKLKKIRRKKRKRKSR